MDVKEELKKWGLLKFKNHYDFFHEIRPMLFAQKLQNFGEQVMLDYTARMSMISSIKTPAEVKKSITAIEDYKRRKLAVDTYFSIIKGAQSTQD